MQIITVKKTSIAALVIVFFFLVAGFSELAEARSRGGGRSFGGRSISKSAPRSTPQAAPRSMSQPSRPGSTGGAFSRGMAGGVAGGLMGGLLGNMLFGGAAHGTGMGGVGGSGLGLFEILLLAGLGYFLYKKFFKGKAFGTAAGAAPAYARTLPDRAAGFFGGQNVQEADVPDNAEDDPLVAGVKEIWQVDETFHPDKFKETAQDLFFKIQSGWTRRDINVLKNMVGVQLLAEYDRHFAQMKEKGQFNRLENIAVRKVDLVQAGVEEGEMFVTVRFTANLLDYNVDEHSGEVVGGDRENPVKFDENWTFARPNAASAWKLEGIEVQ